MSTDTTQQDLAFTRTVEESLSKHYLGDTDFRAVRFVLSDNEWHSMSELLVQSGIPERTLRRKLPEWRAIISTQQVGKKHYYKALSAQPQFGAGEERVWQELPDEAPRVELEWTSRQRKLDAVLLFLADGEWRTTAEMLQATGLKNQVSLRRNLDKGWARFIETRKSGDGNSLQYRKRR